MKSLKWIFIISAFGSVILLASCGTQNKADFLIPDGAQVGDLRLEECTYEMGKEEYLADCGQLIVPENRDNPDSRLISIPVTRIRSTGANPAEPIFSLELSNLKTISSA